MDTLTALSEAGHVAFAAMEWALLCITVAGIAVWRLW